MLLLNNDDVERVLPMEGAIGALHELYKPEYAATLLCRPRTESWLPHADARCQYRCKTMEGGAEYLGTHVLRVASSVDEDEPSEQGVHTVRRPLPGGGWVGMLLVFDATTGELLAIMPDGYLQRTRVGALYAVAADRLARRGTVRVGLLGAGWQAGGQVLGLACVRKIERVRVFSPTERHRRAFAHEMSGRLGVPVDPVESAREAVRDADIVVLATSSTRPVVDASWVEPGQHVSSVRGRELDPRLFLSADRVIVNTAELWRLDCAPGELRARERTPPTSTGRIRGQHVEAWEFFAGTGHRASDDEVTLFPDEASNFRIGTQFAAVASHVVVEARRTGLGRELPREWFTQEVRP